MFENIVRRTPSIPKLGLTFLCANIIVFISCIIPSSAKYSHCTGISTESAAARAFVVSIPSEGGQSINMKSNSCFTFPNSSFNLVTLLKEVPCSLAFFSISISSISTPARFKYAGSKYKFLLLVFIIALFILSFSVRTS